MNTDIINPWGVQAGKTYVLHGDEGQREHFAVHAITADGVVGRTPAIPRVVELDLTVLASHRWEEAK